MSNRTQEQIIEEAVQILNAHEHSVWKADKLIKELRTIKRPNKKLENFYGKVENIIDELKMIAL